MIHELDVVALTKPLPQYHLEAGDTGTVVLVHANGSGYELEFMTFDGETVAVATVGADALRPLGKRDIPHARAVA